MKTALRKICLLMVAASLCIGTVPCAVQAAALIGCVNGDQFQVKTAGAGKPIFYQVNFFSL